MILSRIFAAVSKPPRRTSHASKYPANAMRKVLGTSDAPNQGSNTDDMLVNSSKSERTREFIREQAAPLFNKRGFAGTSLIDLTEATGLSKGALYGNFKDKEGIALATFSYSMLQVRKIMKSRMDRLPSNKKKLIELLEFFGEFVMNPPIPGGCPMMNYGVEADDSQRFMRKSVAREMQSTVSFIQQCLERGVQSGEFKSTIDAAATAQVFFSAIEGAIVVSRVVGDPAPMAAVVAHCRSVLDHITC
jgi:TetR/AcrR family transcriptional repressor of nem operon